MIPWELLDSASLPGGENLTLHRRDREYSIRVAGLELMNSRQHSSEEQLATLATAAKPNLSDATVLVGGLGMGFTLRAVLDQLPDSGRVTVAELVPEVVEWNRDYLAELAARPLDDRRVRTVVADVAELLRAADAAYDVILLDTDNGPEGTTHDSNDWLYTLDGLSAAHAALAPEGVLAIWSAFPSTAFTKRLERTGFDVVIHHVRSRGKKGNRHVIWVARS